MRNTGNSTNNYNSASNNDGDRRQQQRHPRSLFLPLETEPVAPPTHSRNKSDAGASRNFPRPSAAAAAAAAGNSNSGLLHNSRSGHINHIGSKRFGQQQQSGSSGSNNSVLFQPMPALRFPYPPPPIVRRSSSPPVSRGGSGSGSGNGNGARGGIAWRGFDVAQKRSDLAGISNATADERFKSLLMPVPGTLKGR